MEGPDQDDEIDWDELESRLYSQIYHATPEEEDDLVSAPMTMSINTETVANKKYRYYVMPKAAPNRSSASLPSFIALNNTTHKPDNFSISTIQKRISDVESETRNTSSLAPTHVHNNITVNQYTIPQLILQSESACSAEPLRGLPPWHAGDLKMVEKNKVLDKKNKRIQKLQRRLDRRKNKQQFLIQKRLQNSVTIFIDSDTDDECVVVENENTKNIVTKIHTGFPKKYDETNGDKKPEDDDEIIYIAPPPVEIINVDLEENGHMSSAEEQVHDKSDCPSKNSQTHVAEGVETGEHGQEVVSNSESSTCNDFLDNISLGSDSNNQQDFVKPPNPIEYCETESSGSTNEQGRNFSNTVKTIVFDEVDFPKDDIFSDNNLEGFGSFITPKRSNRNLEASPTPKIIQEVQPKPTEKDDSSSDGSSSESDYEGIANRSSNSDRNRHLPNLSLMMATDTPQGVSKKSKTAINFCSSTPKSKKLKSSQTNENTKPKKKQKRNKVVSENLVSETNENMEEIQTEEQQKGSDKEKKGKKKKQPTLEEIFSITQGTPNIMENNNNGKRKKRKSLNTASESIFSPIGKTKKGKKNINTSNNQDDNLKENPESTKKTEENIDDNTSQSVLSTTSDIVETKSSEVEEPTTNISGSDSKDPENKPPLPELSISDMIVIDEFFEEEVVEIIPSESESENDFQILDDVGNDMELANCSAQLKSTNEVSTGSSSAICPTLPSEPTTDFMDFDVENIQKKQSDDPEKWQISYKDRALYLNMDKTRGPRCNRCRHFGHIAIKCTEKPNPPSCTLCGEPDHQEPRCPNKRCTQCGNRGNFSTSYCWKCFKFRHVLCKLCNMKGHIENSCPDLWRRYHSTTAQGPIVTPQSPLLTRDRRWCSGCARQGHLEHECDYYNREYPPTTPFIVRYDDNLAPQGGGGTAMVPAPQAPPSLLGNPNLLPLVNLLQLPVANNLPLMVPHQVPNPFALTSLLGQVQLPFQVPAANFMGNQNRGEMPGENVDSVSRNFDFGWTHIVGATEVDLTDITKVKHLIMTAQADVVREFISKELDELYNNVANCDLKLLRKKLFKYDKMPISKNQDREVREKRFWFRILNMAVFGMHGLWNGRMNCNHLRSFVDQSKTRSLYTERRKSLFSAYSYIFGCDKRKINYYKVMQLMIQRQDEGKLKKITYCR